MSSFCSPNKITVDPNRFRHFTLDHPEVIDMANSIKDIGQLQAVLVGDDMSLIDGLKRITACKRLKRDVFFITESEAKLVLDNPLLRRVAEYQANFKRSGFTPGESAVAIAEIDRLMKEVYGEAKPGKGVSEGWTTEDTAKKLGYKSRTTVADALLVAKAIEADVPGVAEAKTQQEAIGIVKKTVRLEAAQEMARRRSASADETDEIPDPLAFFGERIILGNCLEKMKELPAGICNMFVTDPPWHIGADKMVEIQGSTVQKATGGYNDSSDEIIPLVKNVIQEMFRVSKPDCYVAMFCGIEHFTDLKDHFRTVGFQVYTKPLVWVKTGSQASGLCSSKSPAPSMWPASVTDFMILARKGNAVLAQCHKGDAFLYPPITSGDRIHQAQKPLPLMEEIIARFYHPGTNPLLIDPFAGSGSTLTAARRLGIRQYFGYELSSVNRDRAVAEMVNQYMKELEGGSSESMTTTLNADDFE